MKLEEARVLITGGSSGIGYATAHVLRQAGARVCITGRNAEKLFKAAAELDVHRIVADVSSPEDVQRSVAEADRLMGGLNVLINNAAEGYFSALADMDISAFDRIMATNVRGLILMGQEVSRLFISRQCGNIINISSTAGLSGFAGGTAYVATKFAVRGITECWRAELRKHNIRVMLVNPSEVQTNFAISSGLGERPFNRSKLEAGEIAHLIKALLEMRDIGFVTESTVFATNPRNEG